MYKEGELGEPPKYEDAKIGKALGKEFDLLKEQDRMFSFDFNANFCQDHIVAYRPGSGRIVVYKRVRISVQVFREL